MSNPTPAKSCLTCPSYLSSEKVISKFTKSIGAPVCGRYGYVLGRPGQSDKQAAMLADRAAENCPSWGMPLPPLPERRDLMILMPDPSVSILDDDNPEKTSCTTCAMCKNFIPDRIVATELGWTSGACAAKGKLILTNRQTIEAKNCDHRSFGQTRSNTIGLHLLPEFEDAFDLASDPIVSYFRKGDLVEPTAYPSDRELFQEEKDAGIRAVRKIVDPAGSGNETYLPIYDSSIFSPDELAKIPKTGEDEHPELYIDHFGGVYLATVAWRELDETPALWGEAGVGKTELFRHLAWLMNLPFERISITASTELDDLAGKMMFSNEKGTYFQYGRLPLAWTKPCVLCLDEPNVARNPEVWHFLRPLTDNSKQMVIDANKSERLPRSNECYLGLAMNPAWDVRNVGAEPISDADVSRLFHVFIELPPESLEREIITHRVKLDGWDIDSPRLDAIIRAAREIRALANDGTIPISWGLRPQIKVARAMRWFEPVTAYRRAVADYLEPEAQAAILDVVRSHFATTGF